VFSRRFFTHALQDGTFSISPYTPCPLMMNRIPVLNYIFACRYQLWLSIIKDTENPASKESFFIDLDGTEYEIPYDVW
jgi:hypothetical protein